MLGKILSVSALVGIIHTNSASTELLWMKLWSISLHYSSSYIKGSFWRLIIGEKTHFNATWEFLLILPLKWLIMLSVRTAKETYVTYSLKRYLLTLILVCPSQHHSLFPPLHLFLYLVFIYENAWWTLHMQTQNLSFLCCWNCDHVV